MSGRIKPRKGNSLGKQPLLATWPVFNAHWRLDALIDASSYQEETLPTSAITSAEAVMENTFNFVLAGQEA